MGYIEALRRTWWIAILAAATFVVAVWAATVVLPFSYAASAQYVVTIDRQDPPTSGLATGPYEAQLYANTYAAVLGTDSALLGAVSERVGTPVGTLHSNLHVQAVPSTSALEVSYSGSNAEAVSDFFTAWDESLAAGDSSIVAPGALTRVTEASVPTITGRHLFAPPLVLAGALGVALLVPAVAAARSRGARTDWRGLLDLGFVSVTLADPRSDADAAWAGGASVEWPRVAFASPRAESVYRNWTRSARDSSGATPMTAATRDPDAGGDAQRSAAATPVLLVALWSEMSAELPLLDGISAPETHLLVLT